MVNERRTHNTMIIQKKKDIGRNNDLQNIKQKTKHRATRTPLKAWVNSRAKRTPLKAWVNSRAKRTPLKAWVNSRANMILLHDKTHDISVI